MAEQARPGFLAWAVGYFVLALPLKVLLDWADARWIAKQPIDWGATWVEAAAWSVVFAVWMAALQVWWRRREERKAAAAEAEKRE